jgi:preprotein translocase subunit SecG
MLSRIFALAADTTGAAGTAAKIGGVELALGIAILVMAVFLIIAVLLQSGKDKNLSGAISGSAETFFSKSKSRTWDKILSKLTLVISIIFSILVIVMYIYVSIKK